MSASCCPSLLRDRCHKGWSLIKILVTRILFVLHIIVTLGWLHGSITQTYIVYILCVPAGLILVETIITLRFRRNKGAEWGWFTPCIFLYLLTVVPAIIILEYGRIRILRAENLNGTTSQVVQQNHDNTMDDLYRRIVPDLWIIVLEQTMLLILLVGRWLLPRGRLPRDRLSELLFVYFGIASDIMELFEVMEYRVVLMDSSFLAAVFTVWSLCLLQFCLTLTAQARKTRVAGDLPSSLRRLRTYHILFSTEFWAIVVMITLQDAPFLGCRLYCMIFYRLFTYNIIFFTVKNILVLIFQFYRLAVICYEEKHITIVEHVVIGNGVLPTAVIKSQTESSVTSGPDFSGTTLDMGSSTITVGDGVALGEATAKTIQP